VGWEFLTGWAFFTGRACWGWAAWRLDWGDFFLGAGARLACRGGWRRGSGYLGMDMASILQISFIIDQFYGSFKGCGKIKIFKEIFGISEIAQLLIKADLLPPHL
jgi:hypothetical protein